MGKRVYAQVALLMAGIVALSAVITLLTGTAQRGKEKTRIVASFYPVYVAALNLTQGIGDVELISLTGPQTGCLHDLQLSPDNMITLAEADVLVINGAGAEAFLDDARSRFPELPVVDTSAGISLLESGHAHEHEDGEIHEELVNEHIWTSPSRYYRQVENLRDGLCEADPAHAAQYRDNAAQYLAEIGEIRAAFADTAASLPFDGCILFHESLRYFADDLGLTPLASLPIGEDAGVSAADLAAAQQAAAAAGQVWLLYDSQYDLAYEYLADSAADGRILQLDMGVVGDESPDAWLNAMRENLRKLRGETA